MIQCLENNLLRVEVSTYGAELQSITDKRTGFEYLWQGNPSFWKRRSPVLFPIVGAVAGGHFMMDGREYPMSQHGFARDTEFVPVADTPDDELWYRLEADDSTLALYPRLFTLEIGYRLTGERITVMWRVINRDDRDMSFQIGAHPAFNLPDFKVSDAVHGYLAVDGQNLTTEVIGSGGCISSESRPVVTDSENMIPIDDSTFASDALIIGGSRVRRVSLLDKERMPVLTLFFSTPYVGLWAPKPDAPFVCIEPWYGRADAVGFDGDFAQREVVNTVCPGARFEASYMIIIDNV